MRRAAKRDDNEALIVTALQSAGWTVVRVSDTGVPDLLCAKDGKVSLLEVKATDGTLTKAQEETFARLAKAGVLVQVVRTPGCALDAVGAPWDGIAAKGVARRRWFAVSGAFLCESCWLPENGLHAKDCLSRTALKPKPKVQSAHRAAKRMEEAMPKSELRPVSGLPGVHDVTREWAQRQSRGVEGELQPLKVRVPPRVETCLCGHTASEHWDGERTCLADGGCPCATFSERPPPSE